MTDPVVFLFTTTTTATDVPMNVTHVLVDSSVIEIPTRAFLNRRLLKSIGLPQGLQVIGSLAFAMCVSLRSIIIPSTVNIIRQSAFSGCYILASPELPEGLRFLGRSCFSNCQSFTNIRVPPHITTIPIDLFINCVNLRSVELPEGLRLIDTGAFRQCRHLKIIFLPSSVNQVNSDAFAGCLKIHQALSSYDQDRIVNALKKRFDALPMHKLIYFQGYHSHIRTIGALKKFVTDSRIDTGNRQDAFGMTPYHIFAMSTKPTVEVLRKMVRCLCCKTLRVSNRCPLRKPDRWGHQPSTYILTNASPNANAAMKSLYAQLYLPTSMRLGLEKWKCDIKGAILRIPEGNDFVARQDQANLVNRKVFKYVTKEWTSLLELVIWKAQINCRNNSIANNTTMTAAATEDDRPRKRTKREVSNVQEETHSEVERQYCRMICGSEVIITNVLPFLWIPQPTALLRIGRSRGFPRPPPGSNE